MHTADRPPRCDLTPHEAARPAGLDARGCGTTGSDVTTCTSCAERDELARRSASSRRPSARCRDRSAGTARTIASVRAGQLVIGRARCASAVRLGERGPRPSMVKSAARASARGDQVGSSAGDLVERIGPGVDGRAAARARRRRPPRPAPPGRCTIDRRAERHRLDDRGAEPLVLAREHERLRHGDQTVTIGGRHATRPDDARVRDRARRSPIDVGGDRARPAEQHEAEVGVGPVRAITSSRNRCPLWGWVMAGKTSTGPVPSP